MNPSHQRNANRQCGGHEAGVTRKGMIGTRIGWQQVSVLCRPISCHVKCSQLRQLATLCSKNSTYLCWTALQMSASCSDVCHGGAQPSNKLPPKTSATGTSSSSERKQVFIASRRCSAPIPILHLGCTQRAPNTQDKTVASKQTISWHPFRIFPAHQPAEMQPCCHDLEPCQPTA